ncbi:MAG: tRNA adenosine deaminase-associated protein [Actinomycetes bacterium]
MESVSNDSEDYGVLAWHEDGRWNLQMLDDANDVSAVVDALQAKRVNGGAFALIAIDDEFFVVARALGSQMQMMISDVTYATEYDVAADIIDMLDLPMPEDDDESQPGGDVDLLADHGMSAMELETLASDEDLFPDEQIEAIAWRLGFGEQFSELMA